jgi:large subunit ribosomal protein L28
MARSCAVCGKVSIDGFNAQSSGMNRVRVHRRYHPNLQQTTIQLNGQSVKAIVCTRCMRTLSRATQ